MQKIFHGLKVVELASVLAGPAVGQFFAECGAHVIKVENKLKGGDVTRQWKLPGEQREVPVSAYYASLNHGKEVLMADLRDEADYNTVREHLGNADVVISNHLPSGAKKLGIDETTIRDFNPGMIFGQLLGYRKDQERPAYDAVLQAEMGFISMCGTEDGQPAKMPVALLDVVAAHQLKEGILAALWQRERTGKGAYVDVALDEAALSALVNQASNYLMAGHEPRRMGTRHPNIAPYGEVLTTADGIAFLLAVGTDEQFDRLLSALGLDQHLISGRFSANTKRLQYRNELANILLEKCAEIHSMDLFPKLDRGNIPYGQIRNLEEVFRLPAYHHLLIRQFEEIQRVSVPSVAFQIRSYETN